MNMTFVKSLPQTQAVVESLLYGTNTLLMLQSNIRDVDGH